MLTLKNMSFKAGHKMKITGIATKGTGFSINIGHSEDSLALHFNPRFADHGDSHIIVCNSKKGGSWQSEQRERSFPFHSNEEFKITLTFTAQEFNIEFTNGNKIHFPNRFGDEKFKHIHATGDVRIHSIKIK